MNRTLTAAVALAAALGMAGMAHAQSSTGSSTSPNTLNSSPPSTQMTPPTSPASTQNPATMSSPATSGMPGPQANAHMNQGSEQTSQSQIQQAQHQLKSQGLYRGAVDGVMGPETQIAVSAFQREQGLPQTAQLDQQTLDRLNGSNPGANRPTGQTNTR